MSELFTKDWARRYQDIWNGPQGIADELAGIGFSSVVAFGLDEEEEPRCVLTIANGHVVTAGPPNGEKVIWDLRAEATEWKKLLEKPPGLMKLGLAYTSRKLKFKKGDYAAMIKNAHLANAFVKCFALMEKATH
ncbi:MAG: SCP-2 sterol transfer family protein [Gammaproteobacteria bacterium]|jgi:hypothetical protein|nr:SCP-2 sterol transfer family protein [Gammaproteobacteria bacterium]